MSAPTVRVRGPGSDRWAVANDSHQRLFGDGGAFLPAPLVADRSVVRETRSRFVEVVTLTSGERVVVKRHPYPGWFRGLKRRLPRAPGRVEWSNGLRLQQLGVPCAEPLAYGRVAARGDEAAAEVLVTRFLDGARELRKLAEPGALPPGERSRLIDVLAALVRQLHTAGVCLLDPHMENFLGSRRGANWEITPIDLRRMTLGARFGDQACQENLRLLFQVFAPSCSRAERLQFLTAYMQPADPRDVADSARSLESSGRARLRRFRRRRAAKALKTNSRFEQRSADGVLWRTRRSSVDETLEGLLQHAEDGLASPDRVLKEGGNTRVVLKDGWVIKRAMARGRRHVIDRFRRGAALRAMQTAYLLELCGIPTPVVGAAGKRLRSGAVDRHYLITEPVPDARHVHEAVATGSRDERQRMLRCLGRLVGDLHTHGLGHRDLKGPNILVDVHGQLWLVDLDGLSLRRELGPGRVAHDIARLFRDLRATAGIDRDEELEFAQAYLSVNDMPPLDVPSLLELVDAQPRVRKQQPQRGSV